MVSVEFKICLADISQYVLFNGTTSVTRNIACVVAQGYILGPLLLIPYK